MTEEELTRLEGLIAASNAATTTDEEITDAMTATLRLLRESDVALPRLIAEIRRLRAALDPDHYTDIVQDCAMDFGIPTATRLDLDRIGGEIITKITAHCNKALGGES